MILAKINPTSVLKAHVDSFRVEGTRELDIRDLFLFYVIPVAAGVGLVFLGVFVKGSIASLLMTSLSLFAGLLFNLLVVIYDVSTRTAERFPKLRRELLKELFANISYAIFIALLAIVCLLIASPLNGEVWIKALSAFTFFLTSNFILTMFMILKRVYILLDEHF